jgi:ribosome modulation factor
MKKTLMVGLFAALIAICLGPGIQKASAALTATYVQERGWDAPPPELSEVERRGFHDGIEGAHKDAGNHRRFDVNNREEYQHPHVPQRDREAYRHGFERGYQAGVDHMEREHHW